MERHSYEIASLGYGPCYSTDADLRSDEPLLAARPWLFNASTTAKQDACRLYCTPRLHSVSGGARPAIKALVKADPPVARKSDQLEGPDVLAPKSTRRDYKRRLE